MAGRPRKSTSVKAVTSAVYEHKEATVAMRPEVGTQAQFRKKKAPATYRYDSSLAPELSWDGQNGTRELGEWLLACVKESAALPVPHQFSEPRSFLGQDDQPLMHVTGLQDAVAHLERLGKPFLNWTGKAERLSFDVPTLPLFVHERLSTQAILETLKGHKKGDGGEMASLFPELFGDPQHSVTDQVLRAYEHQDKWTNRMVLGDSLVVMNSLLHYEGMGGQVQMIYMDPPYGVKFGSNFQPFVRKRDVKNNDDDDMTREPEMVKAYRDTWELGLHSYLTYMRDRLLVARDLLHASGSVFVQISDENLHHVREVMDEVFGADNFCSVIPYRTSVALTSIGLACVTDYVLWYAKDKTRYKFRDLFVNRESGEKSRYSGVQLKDGTRRSLTSEEKANPETLPDGSRPFADMDLASSGYTPSCIFDFEYNGKTYRTSSGKSWKTTKPGMEQLAKAGRITDSGKTIRYIIYFDDFPVMKLTNFWNDTTGELDKQYVVQTHSKVIQRCLLMTTDPGDLVLDPTCGSGTTAYVAEQWGRRWITVDTSRVPLALARQRLLTATYPYYELKDETRGPVCGFVYKRRQNNKGEEVGGIVPHITLKSIANDEPSAEEVLVDRPEVVKDITRVTGPFCFEALIPTPMDWEEGQEETSKGDYGAFVDRMMEVLRRSPLLRLDGNKTVSLKQLRPPAKTLSLSAEAIQVNGEERPVALVFGPENGAISEKLVFEAAKEASGKKYAHLYVIGFAIQPHARELVEKADQVLGIPATYVQATLDLMMGDLLKNLRSSEIFSVCGLPDVELRAVKGNPGMFQVQLLGLDVFDPATLETDHRHGKDVPCWMLDTDYNGLCFHVCQAFFPRTEAWEGIRKALRGQYQDSVWDHLAGDTSAPFSGGDHNQVAIKVIDDRGNELMVVKQLGVAK